MKTTIFLLLALIQTLSVANAGCVAKMNKSFIQINDGNVPVSKDEGYFKEFAEEFTKKGYTVCLGNSCDENTVDLSFQVVFMTMIERKLFGYDQQDFFTALVISINGNKTTRSYESDELSDALAEAKKILASTIKECKTP